MYQDPIYWIRQRNCPVSFSVSTNKADGVPIEINGSLMPRRLHSRKSQSDADGRQKGTALARASQPLRSSDWWWSWLLCYVRRCLKEQTPLYEVALFALTLSNK